MQQITACACALLVHACMRPRAATIESTRRNNEIHKKQRLQSIHYLSVFYYNFEHFANFFSNTPYFLEKSLGIRTAKINFVRIIRVISQECESITGKLWIANVFQYKVKPCRGSELLLQLQCYRHIALWSVQCYIALWFCNQ